MQTRRHPAEEKEGTAFPAAPSPFSSGLAVQARSPGSALSHFSGPPGQVAHVCAQHPLHRRVVCPVRGRQPREGLWPASRALDAGRVS